MTTIDALDHASVGTPLTRAGISLIPVYIHGDSPPLVSADTSTVTVTEVADATVPTLTITNTGSLPTLVAEGEVLSGGQQDRVVNTSVLVPATTNLDVPVSCVEHGRWGGGRGFSRQARYASRRVRRAKNISVTENVRTGGSKASDQGRVWDIVSRELDRLDVRSETGSFFAAAEALDHHDVLRIVRDEVARLGPLPGQRGVVVAHGRRIVSCEVFASTELLAAHWAGLVDSWFLDAPDTDDHRRPGLSAALRYVRRIGTTPGDVAPAVGLGEEIHIRSGRFHAQVLVADDSIVHASAFTLAGV